MDSGFYIYLYLDQENVPFYVGKGVGNRYLPSSHNRDSQPYLKNKLRKLSYKNVKVHFLHRGLIEEEAFFWEKYWIKYIGRRDLKEGTLCNLTDGGDGPAGSIQSVESNLKRSINNGYGMLGKHHTEETCTRLSEINKGLHIGEKIQCLDER